MHLTPDTCATAGSSASFNDLWQHVAPGQGAHPMPDRHADGSRGMTSCHEAKDQRDHPRFHRAVSTTLRGGVGALLPSRRRAHDVAAAVRLGTSGQHPLRIPAHRTDDGNARSSIRRTEMATMDDAPQGPGWWQACDLKWVSTGPSIRWPPTAAGWLWSRCPRGSDYRSGQFDQQGRCWLRTVSPWTPAPRHGAGGAERPS